VALAENYGYGTYRLTLNKGKISVDVSKDGGLFMTALLSPRTRSAPIEEQILSDALTVFGYLENQVDDRFPAARIHGGMGHLFFKTSA
jgi:predicted PhzF superfamily epimerase YddE/YHI9